MKEVEVKILDVNLEEIEKKIISLGAKKHFDGEIAQFLYDFPDKRIKKERNTFRLRKSGDKTYITFKDKVKSIGTAKVADEYEVTVSDFNTAKKIIESLGFEETHKMRKHRISYKLANVTFELEKLFDQYEHIPDFIEIEAEDMETVIKYANILGFTEEQCRPWNIFDVDEYYKKLKGGKIIQ